MKKNLNEKPAALEEQVSCPQNKSFLSTAKSASCDYINDDFIIHTQKDLRQLAHCLRKSSHLMMGLKIKYGFYFRDSELEAAKASSDLAEVLGRYKGLTDFYIQDLTNETGHRLICQVVPKNTQIRALTLNSSGSQWYGAKKFFKILGKNTTLSSLKLEIPLDRTTLMSLNRLFGNNYYGAIRHFSLREAELNKENGDLLGKLLIECRKLETLNFGYRTSIQGYTLLESLAMALQNAKEINLREITFCHQFENIETLIKAMSVLTTIVQRNFPIGCFQIGLSSYDREATASFLLAMQSLEVAFHHNTYILDWQFSFLDDIQNSPKFRGNLQKIQEKVEKNLSVWVAGMLKKIECMKQFMPVEILSLIATYIAVIDKATLQATLGVYQYSRPSPKNRLKENRSLCQYLTQWLFRSTAVRSLINHKNLASTPLPRM